jgi:hypothetical protein
MASNAADDRFTLAALGVLAFAVADVGHEGLGHGLATLAVGGKAVFLSTCYFTSDGIYSKWIPAAGGLANLCLGAGSLIALRYFPPRNARLRYFLVLVAAFNLFFAFGYPAYSGVARFGDWAAVISGLQPQWLWRVLLVVISVAGYYASMVLLARAITPFAATAGTSHVKVVDKNRLRRITLIPYISALVLAVLAGALNPGGWRTMLTAGLPAAAASFGFTQLDHLIAPVSGVPSQEFILPLKRSPLWIAAASVVLIVFVGLLGPGIRFR